MRISEHMLVETSHPIKSLERVNSCNSYPSEVTIFSKEHWFCLHAKCITIIHFKYLTIPNQYTNSQNSITRKVQKKNIYPIQIEL